VASGVLEAVADGVIPESMVADSLLIAAVWVNAEAVDEEAVYGHNAAATLEALRAGRDGRPSVADALAARHHPTNAYFAGPGATPGTVRGK